MDKSGEMFGCPGWNTAGSCNPFPLSIGVRQPGVLPLLPPLGSDKFIGDGTPSLPPPLPHTQIYNPLERYLTNGKPSSILDPLKSLPMKVKTTNLFLPVHCQFRACIGQNKIIFLLRRNWLKKSLKTPICELVDWLESSKNHLNGGFPEGNCPPPPPRRRGSPSQMGRRAVTQTLLVTGKNHFRLLKFTPGCVQRHSLKLSTNIY